MLTRVGLCLVLFTIGIEANDDSLPPPVTTTVDFSKHIEPILKERCYGCHGPSLQMSGLRLDSRRQALKGGESGHPSLTPGNSAKSLLIHYVAGLVPGKAMPKNGTRLSNLQIGLLRTWIDLGASYPEVENHHGKRIGADHWAFTPPKSPQIPAVQDTDWVRNPIDAFVLAKLEQRGWKPSLPAKPRALLRRIYLDLIGLPPTLREQRKFLKDSSPEGLDHLVRNLLDRPGYGERWGRHWLDVVRYAETNGYERDATKPDVWKYRDYVIQSFNQDKPYDRFIVEQLAGDELEDATAETHVALGFNRLGPWDDEPADFDQDRFDQLDDLVRTTSEAFLGVTLGCARCHDHKFDPFTQQDYYGMVALFNGLHRPKEGRRERKLPVGTHPELHLQAQKDSRIKALGTSIEKLRDDFRTELLSSGQIGLPASARMAYLEEPKKRTDIQKQLVREHQSQLATETAQAITTEILAQISSLEKKIAIVRQSSNELDQAYFLNEPQMPGVVHVLQRGRAANPGLEAPPSLPASLVASQPLLPQDGKTSKRRLALARWIASPQNPLTARVLVNRVWQQHFGQGLVRTSNDFGKIGDRPSHILLLDWLATRFVKDGWSLKKLHYLIMTSSTYRMRKDAVPEYLAADPENRLLWRVPYTRLQVEAIRDSVLAVSGQLNRKMFGPSMVPSIPEAALEGHPDPDKIWQTSDEREASRRTIYAFVKRTMIIPMLEVLDFCDTTRSTGRRPVTSVAPQALSLFNGEFINRQALYLAHRVLKETGSNLVKQVEQVFLLALCRKPRDEERRQLVNFLNQETEAYLWEVRSRDRVRLAAREKSLVQLCRVVFNLNEFVYPD